MSEENIDLDKCLSEGPQSALEHSLIEEYLLSKGYRMADLRSLPEDQAKALMKEACLFAALKLAEVESKVRFRKEIEAPD